MNYEDNGLLVKFSAEFTGCDVNIDGYRRHGDFQLIDIYFVLFI